MASCVLGAEGRVVLKPMTDASSDTHGLKTETKQNFSILVAWLAAKNVVGRRQLREDSDEPHGAAQRCHGRHLK